MDDLIEFLNKNEEDFGLGNPDYFLPPWEDGIERDDYEWS